MITSNKGDVKLIGSVSTIAADIGCALISFRDAIVEDGGSAEEANEIVHSIIDTYDELSGNIKSKDVTKTYDIDLGED